MACFIVPAAEAIAVTAAAMIIRSREKRQEHKTFTYEAADGTLEEREKVTVSRKLSWLSSLLWGGCLLLAFEHLWHGELILQFPFLTGASSAQGVSEILYEMSTVGVSMALFVTVVWLAAVAVCAAIEKRASKAVSVKA